MIPRDWGDLVSDLADAAATDWIALEHEGRTVTIGELARGMRAVAAALDDGGRFAPVVVSDPDPIRHTLAVLGAVVAGRPALLVDPSHPEALLADAAARAGATVACGRAVAGLARCDVDAVEGGAARGAARDGAADVRGVAGGGGGAVGVRGVAGGGGGAAASRIDAITPVGRPGHAVGSILLTSGSTGAPKLVLRSREADLHAALCLRLAGLPIGPDDRHWLAVPYAAAPFLTLVMGALAAGATVVFGAYERERVGAFLAERAISSTYLVPTMLRLAREHDGLAGPGWDGLRALLTGGERLDDATAAVLLDRFAGRVFCAYGMTECPRLTQASFEELAERPGTVGRVIPLRRARIVEPGTETPVAPGEEGEVLVGGPDLSQGYLGEPPAGRWHRTGDLGRLDADGYLYITGRASSVVKVGGHRVSTEDVAAALRAHPDVAQAAVIAVDDDRWTTRLEAFVVLRDQGPDEDVLTGWLRERVASYQVPRSLHLLDDLPVDSSGKLSLQTLRAMVTA